MVSVAPASTYTKPSRRYLFFAAHVVLVVIDPLMVKFSPGIITSSSSSSLPHEAKVRPAAKIIKVKSFKLNFIFKSVYWFINECIKCYFLVTDSKSNILISFRQYKLLALKFIIYTYVKVGTTSEFLKYSI